MYFEDLHWSTRKTGENKEKSMDEEKSKEKQGKNEEKSQEKSRGEVEKDESQRKKKKKKRRVKSKVAASGSFNVCLITKMPWKLSFGIFITHHSKIRKLSDGNKNWKQKPNTLLSRRFHHF